MRVNVVDQDQTKVKPASTFSLFPQLPPEIRLLIWEMTMEEPRIVLISTPSRKPFSSPTPIPSALHICSESRMLALKTYAVHFARKRHAKDVSPTWPGQIYFNFERDILYFEDMGRDYYSCMWYHFGTCIPQEERDMIRSICVDMVLLNRVYDQHWNGLRNFYVAMKSLRLDMKKPLGLEPLGLREKNAHAYAKSLFKLPWIARNASGRRPVPSSENLRHLIAQVKEMLVSRGRQVAQTAEVFYEIRGGIHQHFRHTISKTVPEFIQGLLAHVAQERSFSESLTVNQGFIHRLLGPVKGFTGACRALGQDLPYFIHEYMF